MRLQRLCKALGCKEFTTEKSGYCEAHRQQSTGWHQYHEQQGGGRDERGYGRVWKRLRAVVIQRDRGLCQQCLRDGRVVPGTDCDHITPKSHGGADVLGNLELLCKACHARKSAREARG